ncbi:hypothetical protein BDR03DRAFT_984391 [Suillus americanus]|nr:hypothetical protein BDR03DRAFT_984391 [Suillus americanus]
MPNVAHSTIRLNMNKVPSPVFSIKTESDSNCEDSDNESTHTIDTWAWSSKEHKAQLVLNATQAQRDNIALGLLYQFKATEAERKLEDAHIDISYIPDLTPMEDVLLQYALVNDAEEMALLDDEEDTTMPAATLVAGAELAQLDRIKMRNPGQLYLCCAQLLPDPIDCGGGMSDIVIVVAFELR